MVVGELTHQVKPRISCRQQSRATTGGLPLPAIIKRSVGAAPPCQPQTLAIAGILSA
jgi:hypothetical protein